MKNVIDEFGEDIHTWYTDEDPDHFFAEITVQTGKPFYAWVFMYGGGIRIMGPENVRKTYLKMARKVARVK